jgi:hypothetical protein
MYTEGEIIIQGEKIGVQLGRGGGEVSEQSMDSAENSWSQFQMFEAVGNSFTFFSCSFFFTFRSVPDFIFQYYQCGGRGTVFKILNHGP